MINLGLEDLGADAIFKCVTECPGIKPVCFQIIIEIKISRVNDVGCAD